MHILYSMGFWLIAHLTVTMANVESEEHSMSACVYVRVVCV